LAQEFVGCKGGLSYYPQGLYNDTVSKKLIVFGNYEFADGISVKGMACWDGENFDSLGTGNKYSFEGKRELIIRYKNKLYAQFNDYYLHSYDFVSNKWQQVLGKFDGNIWDATIFNDELIFVGDFKNVGSFKVRNIIKFDGTNYDTLPKPLFSFIIMSVEVFKNELYIGGNFDLEPFAGIAKFDGWKWDSVGNGVRGGGPPVVTSLQVYNNKLFAAGMWININNLPNPSCAAWDGEKWLNLGGLIYEGGQPAVINELKVYKNKLFVFGGFDYADTLPVHNIAIWNDTNWCGTKIEINFAPRIIENYKELSIQKLI
jgi:hypothetical protein